MYLPSRVGAGELYLGSALLLSLTCVQAWGGFLLPLGKVSGTNPLLHTDHVEFSSTPELPRFPALALAVLSA